MIVLSTTEAPASPNETAWLYNGIDSAVTKEIYEALLPQVMEDDNVAYTYSRSMEKVGPVLEMSLRGIKINAAELQRTRKQVLTRQVRIVEKFDYICEKILGRTYNPASPAQMAKLLYDDLHLPMYRRSRSTDEAHLEQLKKTFDGRVWANFILALRDCAGQLKLLNTKLTDDGRFTYCLLYTSPSPRDS